MFFINSTWLVHWCKMAKKKRSMCSISQKLCVQPHVSYWTELLIIARQPCSHRQVWIDFVLFVIVAKLFFNVYWCSQLLLRRIWPCATVKFTTTQRIHVVVMLQFQSTEIKKKKRKHPTPAACVWEISDMRYQDHRGTFRYELLLFILFVFVCFLYF